jgi:hypothetical protein
LLCLQNKGQFFRYYFKIKIGTQEVNSAIFKNLKERKPKIFLKKTAAR